MSLVPTSRSLLAAVVLTLFAGYGCIFADPDPIDLTINGFSPDNRALSLDVCSKSDCQAVLLNWRSGEVTHIDPSGGDRLLTSAHFSPSGKLLAVAVYRNADEYRIAQLGIVDVEKNSLRVLTNTPTLKAYPTFSPDERRLIFLIAGRERERGATRFADWDVYELDIETGKERPLTNLGFFTVSQAFYLPDGKRFVFSGTRTNHELGYRPKYKDNTVFVRDADSADLAPAFVQGKDSERPRITRNGDIAYVARKARWDGYDIYLYSGGEHRHVASFDNKFQSFVISADGTLIAYLAKREDPEGKKQGRSTQRLFVMGVADGKPIEVQLDLDRMYRKKS